jgi:hypothetical protein
VSKLHRSDLNLKQLASSYEKCDLLADLLSGTAFRWVTKWSARHDDIIFVETEPFLDQSRAHSFPSFIVFIYVYDYGRPVKTL